MAKRILVPLELSAPDEPFITALAQLARGGGATVRLLHVAPVPDNVVNDEGRVVAFVDQEIARLEAEDRDHLQTIELRLDRVPVEAAVRFGDPVREILLEAEAFGADLLALKTTRRSALGRAVLGSVSEQVFRKAAVPVVVFHA